MGSGRSNSVSSRSSATGSEVSVFQPPGTELGSGPDGRLRRPQVTAGVELNCWRGRFDHGLALTRVFVVARALRVPS